MESAASDGFGEVVGGRGTIVLIKRHLRAPAKCLPPHRFDGFKARGRELPGATRLLLKAITASLRIQATRGRAPCLLGMVSKAITSGSQDLDTWSAVPSQAVRVFDVVDAQVPTRKPTPSDDADYGAVAERFRAYA